MQGTNYRHSNEMTFDLSKKLAKLSYEAGIYNILIIGGEPTLWKYLVPFNSFCKELGIQTSLVTNGSTFSNDIFWNKYKACPNDGVGVSLKAGNKAQLYKVARVTNFSSVIKGIRRIMQNYINSSISITLNSFYTENLPELVKLAVECGSKSVKIDFCSPILENTEPVNKYMIEPRELTLFISGIYPELDRITNGHIVFEMNFPFCLWPDAFIETLKKKNQISSVCQLMKREGIIFGVDGRVQMCNALFDFPIGYYNKDFKDAKSLIKFLNSDRIVNFYDQLIQYPSKKCKHCEWYLECGGGCPLRWLIYDPEKIIPTERRKNHERYARID
jgi:radical SAM protein with 4Fe4S-binding SPASM domain